jgi:hypothetical protein
VTTSLLGGFLALACRDDVTEPRPSGLPPDHPSYSSAALGPPQLLLSGISEGPDILLDDISDDRVAYRTTDGGDIYVFDISERGTETAKTRITDDGAFHGPGRISGDRVVWSRDHAQLYEFSLVTHVELPLGLAASGDYQISGDFLAAGDFDFGQEGHLRNLLETSYTAAFPAARCGDCVWALSGDHVVYPMSYGDPNTGPRPTQLSLEDLSDELGMPVTSTTEDVFWADVSGDRVVYVSFPGLYLYNVATFARRQIATVASSHASPRIAGDHVIWFGSGPGTFSDVQHLDLSTGVQTAIPGGTLLSESWIVWASVNETTGFWDLYGIPLTEELTITLTVTPVEVRPVFARCFEAIEQTATKGKGGCPVKAVRRDRVQGRVKVLRSNQPVSGVKVRLQAVAGNFTGGHYHQNVLGGGVGIDNLLRDRPVGRFIKADESLVTEMELTTTADGELTFVYQTSGVSGEDSVRATVVSGDGAASTDTDDDNTEIAVILIREPGLIAMARETNHYVFKDYTDPSQTDFDHGINVNNFVRPSARQTVNTIFATYFEEVSPEDRFINDATRFVITDAGLSFGGLFDFSRGSRWHNPHQFHRTGEDIDIRQKDIPTKSRAIFVGICSRFGAECEIHNGNHYHIWTNHAQRRSNQYGE